MVRGGGGGGCGGGRGGGRQKDAACLSDGEGEVIETLVGTKDFIACDRTPVVLPIVIPSAWSTCQNSPILGEIVLTALLVGRG